MTYEEAKLDAFDKLLPNKHEREFVGNAGRCFVLGAGSLPIASGYWVTYLMHSWEGEEVENADVEAAVSDAVTLSDWWKLLNDGRMRPVRTSDAFKFGVPFKPDESTDAYWRDVLDRRSQML